MLVEWINRVCFSLIAAFCLTPLLVGATPTEFKAAIAHPVAETPVAVAVGDFNNDGIPDLAAVGNPGSSSQVSVLLGTGGGHFLPPMNYPTTCGPDVGMVSADFNKDGTSDLAISCNGAEVIVMLANSDGSLRTPVIYFTGILGGGIALGDYNLDGNMDLAVSGSSGGNKGAVAILFGSGDGTFQNALQYSTGTIAGLLASGDLNGDGAPDLVISHFEANTIGVLLNNGDGTFDSVRNFSLSAQVGAIALADTNGDGNLDLLVTLDSFTLAVAKGDGKGSFAPAKNVAFGEFGAPAVADFDRDGFIDVAVTDGVTDIAVLLGDGNSTFVAPAAYVVGGLPQDDLTADLNGDNYPDLVVAASQAVYVLLNAGNSIPVTLSPTTLTFAAQSVGSTSAPQSVKLINTSASDLTVSAVDVSGDFLIKSRCAVTIPSNGSCDLTIQFRPKATGTRKGVVTLTDSALTSPQKIQLTGTGQ